MISLPTSRSGEFITSGRLLSAAGEEELLAFYLSRTDASEQHAFVIPSNVDGLVLNEGFWTSHLKHPDRLAQVEADRVSYAWDRLIEKFTYHAVTGTQYTCSHPGLADQERILRYLAREGRTRRRMLAKALLGIMERGIASDIAARVVEPSYPGDPHFVFLSVQIPAEHSYDDYRTYRRGLLESYCRVARLRLPNAHDIVGIATEPMSFAGKRSEDLVLLDGALWDDEARADAQEIAAKLGLLTNIKRFESTEPEYPRRRDREMRKGRNRNQACTCGSGRKYKRCHGR